MISIIILYLIVVFIYNVSYVINNQRGEAMNNSLFKARLQARHLSIQYSVWYVRHLGNGVYAPYAHSSDDENTVACFISGEEFIE